MQLLGLFLRGFSCGFFIDYMQNMYFENFLYLFSHQVCYVHMNLEEFYQGTTQLLPEKMDMATDTKLPQYFIQSWQLVYMRSGAYITVTVTVCLPLKLNS